MMGPELLIGEDFPGTQGRSAPAFASAQSNSALYAQLLRSGAPLEDVAAVQTAYRAAAHLFEGRYRVNGRAFICHVTGAGSAAACFTGRSDLVVAAMLHSAYRYGIFPDGKGGATSAHREWLRKRVGEKPEALIAAVHTFDFEARLPDLVGGSKAPEADLIFLSLAHELDELADGGMILAPKHVRDVGRRIEDLACAARTMGLKEVAQAFASVAADHRYLSELGAEALAGAANLAPQRLPRVRSSIRQFARRLKSSLRRGKSPSRFS